LTLPQVKMPFTQENEVSPEPELGPGWRKVEIKVDNRVVKTRAKYWNPEGKELSYKDVKKLLDSKKAVDQTKEPVEEQRTDQQLSRRMLLALTRQVKASNQQPAQEAGSIEDGRSKPGGKSEKVSSKFMSRDVFSTMPVKASNRQPAQEASGIEDGKLKLGGEPERVNSRFTFKEALLTRTKKGRRGFKYPPDEVMAKIMANEEEKEEADPFPRPAAAATQKAQFLSPRADGQELPEHQVSSAGAASPDIDKVQQEPTVSLKINQGEASNEDAAPLASQTTNKRLREEAQMGEVIEIKDDEEEDVTAIAALASKKMRFEVEVKKQELKNLKVKKQEAVDKVKKISSELEAVHELTEQQKGLLKQHKGEEKSYEKQVEAFETEIEALRRKRMDASQLKAEKRLLAKDDEAAINMSKEKGTRLERQLGEAKLEIKKVEKEIADLPSAPGYNQDMLNLLDNQIAAKKRELECPVCFEEAVPPIYTCNAQHLVCVKCRPSLKECGTCRVPYQELLRHRYAERDHEELVALCHQRSVMGPKLAEKRSPGQVEEGPALEPAVAVPLREEVIQIFVEMPSSPKRTIVLMMRPSSTVKEVKEMVLAKEGGIPVARQRLRTSGGKCLWQDELSLEEYGVSKWCYLLCYNNVKQ